LKARVLIVDDERRIRLVLDKLLKNRGYEVSLADGGESALAMIADEPPDLVLLDLKMSGLSGMETLQRLRESGYGGKVVIMTAYGTIESAVEAMREGAYDYITKPFSNDDLLHSIERALDHERLKRELEMARRQLEGKFSIKGVIAASPAMIALLETVRRIAPTGAPALIVGESGTGKEVVARAVHARSPRRDGPFVAVNCGALPGELLESELFGHVRGAFTGAVRDREGRFEMAVGGTLFLDEVAEMPVQLQVKLLRVLQERTFERVGESQSRRADSRIIAATNADLKRAVLEGRFREDLYYRLRVVPIEIPPLRERREDIEPLSTFLLARVGARQGRALRFSPDALRLLLRYSWPGNVRELENALEFAVAVCKGQTVLPEDLPGEVRGGEGALPAPAPAAHTDGGAASPEPSRRPPPPADAAQVRAALEACHWRRHEAARLLGISRTTLWRRMRELGLD
jgi:DNA-binding NtrC family response regulator